MLKVMEKEFGQGKNQEESALDRLAREGAQRMLAEALEAEVEGFLERHRKARGQDGHALVVRNGRAQVRHVTVGAGTLAVEAPRVNDQRVVRGDRQKFASQILPLYLRKPKAITELLPALYPRGRPTGDFRDGLAALPRETAAA